MHKSGYVQGNLRAIYSLKVSPSANTFGDKFVECVIRPTNVEGKSSDVLGEFGK